MKAGEISIDLTIDDKDFTIRLKNGEQLLSRFSRQLDSTARSTKAVENHFSSLSTRFRHFMIMVASTRFALLDIHDVFLALPISIIKTSGEMERLTKLMEGLSTASGEAAKKMEAASNVRFVFDLAQNAPFQVNALADAFVKLKTGGIDPTNGSLQALVDSVAKFGGDAQKLNRAAIAIQQMAGKGVISMEELRQQLGEAVPNAIEMMAVGTGLSMSKLVKLISNGQVKATGALERMFEVMRARNDGAAAAMMNTWTGLIERLKTKWTLAKVEMGGGEGALFDSAKEEVKKLIDSFDNNTFRQFGVDIAYASNVAMKGISTLIEGVKTYYEEIKTAGQVLLGYWLATNVVSGTSNIWAKMRDSYQQNLRAMERDNREAHKTALALRQKELEAAQAQYASLQNMASRHRAAMTAADNRLTRNNSNAAEILSQARMIEGQARAIDLRTEAGRRLQTELQREAAAMRNQAQALGATNVATLASRNAHIDHLRVLQTDITERKRYIEALNNQVIQQGRVTMTARAMIGMKTALVGMWNAVGGAVGVVTIALTYGIMKWIDYAGAAERAAERARNAARGISTAQALTDAESELSRNRTDQGTQMNILGDGYTGPGAEKARKRLEELKKREAELNLELGQHRDNLARDRVRDAVTRTEIEAEDVRRGVTTAYQAASLKQIEDLKKIRESEIAAITDPKKAEAARKALDKDVAKLTSEGEKNRGLALKEFYNNRISDMRQRMLSNQASVEEMQAMSQSISDMMMKVEEADRMINNKIGQFGKDDLMFGELESSGGGGGSKSKGPSPLESLLDRVADKMATINAELDKRGSGDLAKILSDLDQIDPSKMIANGKKMTKEEVIDMIMPGLVQGEWRLEFEKSFDDISNTIGEEMIRISAELDGGRSSIERLRNDLNELGLAAAAAADGDRVGRISQLIDRLNELQQQQSKLSLRELSQEFMTSIGSIRASLSDDPDASIYAAWSEDIAKFQEKIIAAKLDTEQAQEAQRLFAEYVKVTYAKLQRDIESPVEKLAREWIDTTKQMEEATARWANGAADALTDFVITGKANFADFAESIIRDLVRMQMQAAMGHMIKGISSGGWVEAAATAIGGFFGFANGGIMSEFGSMPLKKYANGGVAYSPQVAVFGEGRTPEAYVPLPDGRTIPVTMTGGQAAAPIVNINVHEAPGTKTQVNQSQDGQGNLTLDIVVEQIEGKMASNLARGRSQIGTTMENVYGLNRAAGARR